MDRSAGKRAKNPTQGNQSSRSPYELPTTGLLPRPREQNQEQSISITLAGEAHNKPDRVSCVQLSIWWVAVCRYSARENSPPANTPDVRVTPKSRYRTVPSRAQPSGDWPRASRPSSLPRQSARAHCTTDGAHTVRARPPAGVPVQQSPPWPTRTWRSRAGAATPSASAPYPATAAAR